MVSELCSISTPYFVRKYRVWFRNSRCRQKERRKRAEQALENAKLLSFKDQYPHQLSGGMQQRVGWLVH